MMGGGMMGGFGGLSGFGGFSPFDGVFMLLGALVPLAFLALVILGVVWFARSVTQPQARSWPQPPVVGTSVCPQCGRSIYADWVACPYCGKNLR